MSDTTEEDAERHFANKRWPSGVKCPKCASVDVRRGTQPGRKRQLWYCRDCNGQFSVTSGTIMDSTKLPLSIWRRAAEMIRDGANGHQLHIRLGVAYSCAWALSKRIVAAIEEGDAMFTDGTGASTPFRLHKPTNGTGRSLLRSAHGQCAAETKYELRGAQLTVAELAVLSGRAESAICAALRGGRSAEQACFGYIITLEPNDRVGMLTILEKDGGFRVCRCDCGNVKRIRAYNLKAGDCFSCGCYRSGKKKEATP